MSGGDRRRLSATALVGSSSATAGARRTAGRRRSDFERLEEELGRRELGFRALFEQSLDPMLLFDDQRRMLDGNPAACAFFGLSRDELRAHSIDSLVVPAELVVPEDFGIGREDLIRFFAGEVESCMFEKRLVRADGRVVWVHARLSVVRDEGNRPIHGICQLQDVTHRREAHEALRASEQRLRTLVQTAHEGIWTFDAEDRTSFVNVRMAEMLGYPTEEMLGRHVSDFIYADTRALMTELLAARRRGVSDQHELRLRRRDGGEVWAIVSGSPYLAEDGSYAGSLAMVTDITERRRQEQAVRAAAERYRNIIETTSEGVWMIDADQRTTYVNRRMARMLGYAVEEMLGRRVEDFVADDGGKLASDRHTQADQREVRYRRKDGSVMWGLRSGSPLTDGSGAYGGALAMISDITERKEAEEALARLRIELSAKTESAKDAGVKPYVNTANPEDTGRRRFAAPQSSGQRP